MISDSNDQVVLSALRYSERFFSTSGVLFRIASLKKFDGGHMKAGKVRLARGENED